MKWQAQKDRCLTWSLVSGSELVDLREVADRSVAAKAWKAVEREDGERIVIGHRGAVGEKE